MRCTSQRYATASVGAHPCLIWSCIPPWLQGLLLPRCKTNIYLAPFFFCEYRASRQPVCVPNPVPGVCVYGGCNLGFYNEYRKSTHPHETR